jgi:hypothetical protein
MSAHFLATARESFIVPFGWGVALILGNIDINGKGYIQYHLFPESAFNVAALTPYAFVVGFLKVGHTRQK